MNYRHIWHAGNFADVFKHIILVALIDALQRKDTACFYLDTHAGIGLYDLNAAPAKRTGESNEGIAKLRAALNPPLLIQKYLSCFPDNPNLYPGSPHLIRALLRPTDRLTLCELHAEDSLTLKAHFRSDPQVGAHQTDGWQSLKAFLPPPENRGLVLIDPPYELPDEFQSVADRLKTAVIRWPNGLYALWYPIKSCLPVSAMTRALREKIARPVLITEIHRTVLAGFKGLSGCGMALVNPPWQIETELTDTLSWLCKALGDKTKYTLLL